MAARASRLAANAVAAAHFAVGVFALFGGALLFVSRWWMWIHIPLAVWMVAVNLADLTCPLTTLERACRRNLGDAYESGFIARYGRALPTQRSPRQLEIMIGTAILVWNVLFYGAVALFYRGS